MTPDVTAFSRARAPGNDPVELRGDCPRITVDILDAVSNARRISRTELVNQILGEWAKQQFMEASLIQRVTRGNPEAAELLGAVAEPA